VGINGTASSIQVTPATLIGARFDVGKVNFPVAGNSTYVSFEHVRGIPSGDDGGGYSASRLHIINRILDRMTNRSVSENELNLTEASELLSKKLHSPIHGSVYGTYTVGDIIDFAV